MTFQLRQYQIEAARAGIDFMRSPKKRNGIIVAPTGCGKSILIAEIAKGLDGPCLVFQPSKEILEQNLAKFQSYGYRPAVFSASMNRKTVGEITLATIGSVAGNKKRASKAHLFQDFPYVIVDECDLVNSKVNKTTGERGQYKSFFDELDVKILGLTATPYRLTSDMNGSILKWITRTQPRVFQEVVYYIQTGDLFDEGYLQLPTYKHWPAINRHAVKANSKGTDYDDRALQLHMFKSNFQDKLVKAVRHLKDEVKRKNCLIFTRYVPEAQYLASKVDGIAVVTAETPKDERTAIVREWQSGRIWGVANVGIFVCGVDFPGLETVLLSALSKSLRKYYQEVGRGVRLHPDKKDYWLVDLVGMVQEFGKIEDLKIVDGGNGKWFIENTERQLTNVYMSNEGASRCHDCGAEVGFWMRHAETGNRAPLQRPGPGQQGNINLVRRDGKTYYTVVPPGQGEFVHHSACCERRRLA